MAIAIGAKQIDSQDVQVRLVCVRACVRMHTYMYVYVCMHMREITRCKFTYIQTYIHTYILVHPTGFVNPADENDMVKTYIHIYTHKYIHAYTHTCIHTLRYTPQAS